MVCPAHTGMPARSNMAKGFDGAKNMGPKIRQEDFKGGIWEGVLGV